MTVALITGGSKGIGLAVAELFVSKGYQVIICSRDENNLSNALELLSGNVEAFKCDISENANVEKIFKDIKAKYGQIDILVNSAAIIANEPFETMKISEFEKVFDINFKGPLYCIKQAFKYMSKGGSIVNISSLGGIQGFEKFPGFSAYSASKFALTGLTEILSVEAKEKSIRINAIAPGAVNTDMLEKAAPGLKSKTQASDVAKIIDFLTDAEKSGYINGSIIPINTNL